MGANKGILIVVSGPSGVGKGTVCKELLKRNADISLSVSATTRSPRTEDVDGETYYFKSREQFENMIENDGFLEWAMYNGNYYGTPKEPVKEKLAFGKDVLLEIEVQGAMKVKEKFPQAVYVFIVPPDFEELKNRLLKRGTETENEIQRRMDTAMEEMSKTGEYNYVIVNDDLEQAVRELENVIHAEKHK